jgi:hypothetical protein
MLLRLPSETYTRLDAERRLYLDGIPSRCALIRRLIDEALTARACMRPSK